MSNIFAAIGRIQLKKLDVEFAPKRKSLFERYRLLLSGKKYILLQEIEKGVDIIPHIMSIRILEGKRDGLKNELEAKGVPTGIHYKPNHLLSYYGRDKLSLPVTENIYKELLTLPLHPEISISEVEYICHVINNYLEKE